MEPPGTHDEDERPTSTSASDPDPSDGFSDQVSEDEETSSSGSSSEAETDSDEDEEPADAASTSPTSPPFKIPKLAASPTALKSRLASFLPQLQQANAELDTDPNASTKRVDQVADDEEQYIEMNLGLGVLKSTPATHQGQDIKTAASGEGDSPESETEFEDDSATQPTEVSIVDKLKGVKPSKRKIEEVS